MVGVPFSGHGEYEFDGSLVSGFCVSDESLSDRWEGFFVVGFGVLVVEVVEEGLFEPGLESCHGDAEVFEFGCEAASVEGV